MSSVHKDFIFLKFKWFSFHSTMFIILGVGFSFNLCVKTATEHSKIRLQVHKAENRTKVVYAHYTKAWMAFVHPSTCIVVTQVHKIQLDTFTNQLRLTIDFFSSLK